MKSKILLSLVLVSLISTIVASIDDQYYANQYFGIMRVDENGVPRSDGQYEAPIYLSTVTDPRNSSMYGNVLIRIVDPNSDPREFVEQLLNIANGEVKKRKSKFDILGEANSEVANDNVLKIKKNGDAKLVLNWNGKQVINMGNLNQKKAIMINGNIDPDQPGSPNDLGGLQRTNGFVAALLDGENALVNFAFLHRLKAAGGDHSAIIWAKKPEGDNEYIGTDPKTGLEVDLMEPTDNVPAWWTSLSDDSIYLGAYMSSPPIAQPINNPGSRKKPKIKKVDVIAEYINKDGELTFLTTVQLGKKIDFLDIYRMEIDITDEDGKKHKAYPRIDYIQNIEHTTNIELGGNYYKIKKGRLLFQATVLRAAYNYQPSRKEPHGYIHNPVYTAYLLVDSYNDLGEDSKAYSWND